MPAVTLELRHFSRVLALSILCVACGGADRDGDGAGRDGDGAPADSPPAADSPAGLASAAPITDQELQRFRLTEDRLRAWHRVQLAAAQQPDLRLQDDDVDAEEVMNGAAATRLLQRIGEQPQIASTIRGAGMEPREFVIVTFALAHGVVGHAVTQAGQPVPPGTNAQNVEFVRQHEAELRRMREDQEAARRAAGPPS
jgi:hypothetical protein